MILETISCLVVVILYGGFAAFKKENRQELLEQISNELKQEQSQLLIEKIKAEQALLPPPILNDKPKKDFPRPPIWPEKQHNPTDHLEIIFDYLRSHDGREIMYSQQRFLITYLPSIRTVALYEINNRTRDVSKTSSLTICQSFSERSYKKFERVYKLKMYGILSHKESLLLDFKKYFTLTNPYTSRDFQRTSTKSSSISEYHSFILQVKKHYTENDLTRRYHKIDSADTFLQYCQIVGISYTHLDSTALVQELRRLETGKITLEEYTSSPFIREMVHRF